MLNNFEMLAPAPSATIESLTGAGYTLKTALADLIDNSITAMASNIWLTFNWDGADSTISILDDGLGMSESELSEAMRPGGKNPLHIRDESDLGRFSFGLKTASWSQARCLSVWTKNKTKISSMRWDLDYVQKHNEWRALKELNNNGELEILDKVKTGTYVEWTNLSLPLFKEEKNSSQSRDEFNSYIEEVSYYLSMIFHRFILGTTRFNKNKGPIKIYINGNSIKGWNPFDVSEKVNSQVTPLDEQVYLDKKFQVRGYVLPHKDKLSDLEYQNGGGPNGWLDQQGFYIFRADRLLVSGSWLGLGSPRAWGKEEQYRLARISVDIPNSQDKDWQLDILKSKAIPPPQLKQKLVLLAERVREDAKKSFIYRGKYGPRPSSPSLILQPTWESDTRDNVLIYRINKKHPLIEGFRSKTGSMKSDFDAVIRLIEESVPVQKIWIDAAETDQNHAIPYEGRDEELISDLKATFKFLLLSMSRDKAIETLKVIEPFNRHIELIEDAVSEL